MAGDGAKYYEDYILRKEGRSKVPNLFSVSLIYISLPYTFSRKVYQITLLFLAQDLKGIVGSFHLCQSSLENLINLTSAAAI